jgi:hypothetical protein
VRNKPCDNVRYPIDERKGPLKGIIFNAAEEVLTELYGADVWDSLLKAARTEGSYTRLGNYEDAEIVRIVAAAASLLELGIDDTWRFLGRHMAPKLVALSETVASSFDGAEQFVRSVNNIIHHNVKVLYPDAQLPIFEFTDTPAGLQVRYQSDRGLNALAEGLIIGAGDLFGESVQLDKLERSTPTDSYYLVAFSGRHD